MIKEYTRITLNKTNWKLLIIIILFTLIPVIYKTTRIFFIGTIDDGYSYSIASQIQWLNIIYEILTEALIVPIFFVFSNIKKRMLNNLLTNNDRATITLLSIVIFSIYFVFTIIIFFILKPLINLVLNDSTIIEKSIEYMRYETWSIFITSMASYMIVIIFTLRLRGFFLISIIINISYLVINVLLDLFIMSGYNFSLNLGFVGAGISSIASSTSFFLISLSYLIYKKVFFYKIIFINLNNLDIKTYLKNFIISASETTVRNIVFSYMIIGMMNLINEQGTYWQANSFIWTWLLIPVSILSLYIKETHNSIQYYSDKKTDLIFKLNLYLFITILFVIIWCAFIPLNPIFMKNVLGYKNYDEVNKVVMILFTFYICFAFSSIIDAIFIADGKILMFLIQTLFVNLTIYPIYFILYKTNIWVPSLESITLMFGLGLLEDLIVDVILLFVSIKKEKFPLIMIMNNFTQN